MNRCIAVAAGLVDYIPAWELQKELHRLVADGTLPDLLLLLEHPHVYTLGRRGSLSDILASPEVLSERGIEVHHVDRGGEVTYHGPGQLVGYPIVDLRRWGGGPLRYVRALEEVLIDTLAEFGVSASGEPRPTGVWTGESKIAAIGVKVSRGVTTHGFALNVNPDLSFFDHIVPCGMPDAGVTAMSALVTEEVRVGQVIPVLARCFADSFGCTIEWATLDDLRLQPEHLSTITSGR